MIAVLVVLLLSAIMGLSIFITLPLIVGRGMRDMTAKFLGAVSVGILVFLIADVFTDSASILYNNTLAGYGTNGFYDLIFSLSLIAGFVSLYLAETRSRNSGSPYMLSLFIALGIGFQNLTEGLVFGASYNSIGLVGVTLVILVGFILQNVTEGFPISAPFISKAEHRTIPVALLFLVGGLPTIIGGGVGFFYSSRVLDLVFDGLAIGAMFYVILPILRSLFRNSEMEAIRIVYMGSFLGFMLGFLVNLV